MTSPPGADDLRPLHDTVLAPRLAALERERLALRRAIVASAILVGVPGILILWGGDLLALVLPAGTGPWLTAVGVVLLLVGIAVAIVRYAGPGFTAYLNYRARFKREVVAEIFKAVSPGATYLPDSFIQPEIFDRSGLFDTTGGLRGDDLVRGRVGDTPFEACEMDRHFSTGGKNSRTVSVFHGLFFRFDFNKTVQGRTIVQPQRASSIRLGSRKGLTRVTLESPTFEAEFDVFSTNPVEARYILTPAMMENILDIHTSTGRPICLAFQDNLAFVAVDYGRALFEPSIADTTSFAALAEMARHFQLAALVAQELDLNTRIWTKDVDARLLDDVPAESPLGNLNTGDLTVNSLLQNVTGQLYADTDAGGSPQRPAWARSCVDHLADETIVRYRLAWWALVCIGFSAAFVALAAIAVSTLIDPDRTLAFIDPNGVLNPEGVTAFRSGASIAIAVSAVVGGFFSLYWITYVRRVVIGRDEIRVRRGLSPFARRYPRTEQTRILQMDRYLYLGQSAETRLINPSLSPMLRSAEEARWVASEMRRALATGRGSPAVA